MAVLGGGIHGLCTAWQLRRRGVARVAVFERFSFGHARGSSHGTSRIIRSSYHDPLYVRLAQQVRADWSALADDLGGQVVHPAPGVFFGPPSARLAAFIGTTLAAGAEVEVIDPAAAQRRFPLLALAGASEVLLDRTCGVIAADVALAGLSAWLARHGVALHEHTRVRALRALPGAIEIDSEGASARAAGVVIAAGAFVGELVPELRARLTVRRQSVGYFALAAEPAAVRAPSFPVWCFLGEGPDDFVYGLPEIGRPGVKLARHATRGPADDPQSDPQSDPIGDPLADPAHDPAGGPACAPAALADLDACARRAFGARLAGRVGSETCLYTVTADEHFLLDTLPVSPRLVVLSACSGHGFKFAPLLGRLAAEVLLDGKRPPPQFALHP